MISGRNVACRILKNLIDFIPAFKQAWRPSVFLKSSHLDASASEVLILEYAIAAPPRHALHLLSAIEMIEKQEICHIYWILLFSCLLKYVLPFCNLGGDCKKCLLSLANGKSLSPDIRIFIGVVHEHPEPHIVVLFDPVAAFVRVKQDWQAELCVGAVDLVWRELWRLISIRAWCSKG